MKPAERRAGAVAAAAAAAVADLVRRLEALGSKERAVAVKKYMKSELAFYGVPAAELRRASNEVLKAMRAGESFGRAELIAFAAGCYEVENFDLRSAAIAVLDKAKKLLEPADLPELIRFVKVSSCWAHVDYLATKVIAAALAKAPEAEQAERIRRWARDPELWVRRTALLVQHDELKKGRGDFALFAEIAAPMLEEKVFWIRKAIGWVLREVSKKRPALVQGFIRAHGERMSGLTRREAEKYLPG
jgi:3-methyladenine DNA glycosylase AlkD